MCTTHFLPLMGVENAGFAYEHERERTKLSVTERRRSKARISPPITAKKMVRPKGLEPLTFWSVARRSIQLSYERTYTIRR